MRKIDYNRPNHVRVPTNSEAPIVIGGVSYVSDETDTTKAVARGATVTENATPPVNWDAACAALRLADPAAIKQLAKLAVGLA